MVVVVVVVVVDFYFLIFRNTRTDATTVAAARHARTHETRMCTYRECSENEFFRLTVLFSIVCRHYVVYTFFVTVF